MHSDRPFLEAIREQPDDDLHRLAWADWLEERGDDDRATFLRAQLFAARLDETDLALDPLEDRADDLLAVRDRAWAGRVGELAVDWGWSRGCVESATLTADTLLGHGDELFETTPIRNLRLLAGEDDLPRLAGCAWLEWVEHLERSAPGRCPAVPPTPTFVPTPCGRCSIHPASFASLVSTCGGRASRVNRSTRVCSPGCGGSTSRATCTSATARHADWRNPTHRSSNGWDSPRRT